MPNRTLVALVPLCLASALAAKVNVTIGGQSVALDAVTVGGKTYVSLDGLKQALAAQGGADQRASLEGCVNEWLFNGIWRMRVTGVEAIQDPGRGGAPGWGVTVEFRNGTKNVINLSKTGVEKGTSLALRSGNTLANSEGSAWVDAIFKDVPQAAAHVFRYNFWHPDGTTAAQASATVPAKLIVQVDPNQLKNWVATKTLKYTVPNPSFRVDLTCRK